MWIRLLLSACCLLSQAALAEPTLRDKQLADLEAARKDYVLRSLAFSPKDRGRALLLLDQAKRKAGTYSDAQFAMLLAQVAALADNGHDQFMLMGWTPDERLPLRTAWFSDGLVIARAAPEVADLLGARILSVDGQPVANLVKALNSVSGGQAYNARWNASYVFEFPSLLHAIGFAHSDKHLRLSLLLPNGRVTERTIGVVPKQNVPRGTAATLLSMTPIGQEQANGWHSAVKASTVPLYLQEPDTAFRVHEVPELQALYVQFRANYDADGGKTLSAFAKQVSELIAAKAPHNVILDQRFNTGGNTDLTMDLMRELGAKATGRVYIITSQYTFSAGIVSSALTKRAAGSKAVIVGEPVGDRLRWWSEGQHVCLPNSMHCFQVTTGLWDLEKGCGGEENCYGERFNATVGSLTPQLAAPLTSADWIAGRDPSMDAIAADIRRSSSAP